MFAAVLAHHCLCPVYDRSNSSYGTNCVNIEINPLLFSFTAVNWMSDFLGQSHWLYNQLGLACLTIKQIFLPLIPSKWYVK